MKSCAGLLVALLLPCAGLPAAERSFPNFAEARSGAASLRPGGHGDWRLPTIRALFSLMDRSGSTALPGRRGQPFIDGRFDFRYGDTGAGERTIDAQFWSAAEYVGRTMGAMPRCSVSTSTMAASRVIPRCGRGRQQRIGRTARGGVSGSH